MQRSMTAADTALGKPGTAQLDVPWEELGFEFRPTKSHARIVYKNGEWGPTELVAVSVFDFPLTNSTYHTSHLTFLSSGPVR